MAELVYLNGELLPGEQARISPLDHGFLYGYGLFETMRAYDGRIFRLQNHIERLMSGARLLGFASKLNAAALGLACLQIVEANHLKEAAVRLAVSAGEGEARPDPSTCGQPTIFALARPYAPPASDVYGRGYKAIVSSLRRDSLSPLSYIKSASYMLSVLARREAKQAGADEPLLLNEQGFVAEGSLSNLFIVKDGCLLTPDRESGILPGIAREAVLELALPLGIEAEEVKLSLAGVLAAEEAFLTSSLMEVMPLTHVGGRAIGSGRPGPVTGKLMAAYRGLVAREI